MVEDQEITQESREKLWSERAERLMYWAINQNRSNQDAVPALDAAKACLSAARGELPASEMLDLEETYFHTDDEW